MSRLTHCLLFLLFAISSSAFSSCLSGDCENGRGVFAFADGSTYEGEHQSGQMHGKGKYTGPNGGFSYDGQWRLGQREGLGTMRWADGEAYEGEWLNDMEHGRGKYTYASGGFYDGEFRQGKKEGQGTRRWEDGEYYQGQWVGGKIEGMGTYYFAASGSTHTGSFKDGVKHGIGVEKDKEGNVVLSGVWRDGVFYKEQAVEESELFAIIKNNEGSESSHSQIDSVSFAVGHESHKTDSDPNSESELGQFEKEKSAMDLARSQNDKNAKIINAIRFSLDGDRATFHTPGVALDEQKYAFSDCIYWSSGEFFSGDKYIRKNDFNLVKWNTLRVESKGQFSWYAVSCDSVCSQFIEQGKEKSEDSSRIVFSGAALPRIARAINDLKNGCSGFYTPY